MLILFFILCCFILVLFKWNCILFKRWWICFEIEMGDKINVCGILEYWMEFG